MIGTYVGLLYILIKDIMPRIGINFFIIPRFMYYLYILVKDFMINLSINLKIGLIIKQDKISKYFILFIIICK